jgi:23S rRNA (adenine2503-C2)-methyltransferase
MKVFYKFINDWIKVKNDVYCGEAGLQLSINSTSEKERKEMFSGNSQDLGEIALNMAYALQNNGIKGRKITLNFAVAGYEIDAKLLAGMFPPKNFICKLAPMHKTKSAINHGLKTNGDYTEYYPYQHHEEDLKKAGYDVLVFIASKEEDESRITCGNAILGDRI